jgi:Tfp pilus assembly protein PilV
MIAIAVLMVGVLSTAAVISSTVQSSGKSTYMSTAAMLATEKLEDLSRLPATDSSLLVPTGATSAGSITTSVVNQTIGTCNVDYSDIVYISVANGQFSEVTTGKDASGNVQYTLLQHSAAGAVSVTTQSTLPSNAQLVQYIRRWVIEKDVTVNGSSMTGLNRITVKVSSPSSYSATYQASMIRQYPTSGGTTTCDAS